MNEQTYTVAEAAVKMIREGVCMSWGGCARRWHNYGFEYYTGDNWQPASYLALEAGGDWRVVPDPSAPEKQKPGPKVVDVDCVLHDDLWQYHGRDGYLYPITGAPSDPRFVEFAWRTPCQNDDATDIELIDKHYAPIWWEAQGQNSHTHFVRGAGYELLTPHLHMLDRDPEIGGRGPC